MDEKRKEELLGKLCLVHGPWIILGLFGASLIYGYDAKIQRTYHGLIDSYKPAQKERKITGFCGDNITAKEINQLYTRRCVDKNVDGVLSKEEKIDFIEGIYRRLEKLGYIVRTDPSGKMTVFWKPSGISLEKEVEYREYYNLVDKYIKETCGCEKASIDVDLLRDVWTKDNLER